MKNKMNKPVVIEDVVWYTTEQNEDGSTHYKSLAENTFYYQFLIERCDDSTAGKDNQKALEQFLAFQKIYVFLLSSNILKEYSMDFCEIYGGATFTFDVTHFSEAFDIEKYLMTHFKGQGMDTYINQFCLPSDESRCHICGASTLNRSIVFTTDAGVRTPYCMACYPLKEKEKDSILHSYQDEGSLAAIKKRIDLVNQSAIIKVAQGLTIDDLLNDFIESFRDSENKEEAEYIQRILDAHKMSDFEAFPHGEDGVILWNRRLLRRDDIFYSVCTLSSEGTDIVFLGERAGVCYIDDNARRFAKKVRESKNES